MSGKEEDLRAQLENANRRIAALEHAQPYVVVIDTPPARNALQTVSDWWHGGSSQGARTRHMRVDY